MDLIQIPLNFYQLSDPFFTPVEISFSVNSLHENEYESVQAALLAHNNFLLMQASSFEWVHVSGVAFVTMNKSSFSWYFNSLLIERDKAERGAATDARALLDHFRKLVQKYEAALRGEPVLGDSVEMFAILSLLPGATMRPNVEALMLRASTVPLPPPPPPASVDDAGPDAAPPVRAHGVEDALRASSSSSGELGLFLSSGGSVGANNARRSSASLPPAAGTHGGAAGIGSGGGGGGPVGGATSLRQSPPGAGGGGIKQSPTTPEKK